MWAWRSDEIVVGGKPWANAVSTIDQMNEPWPCPNVEDHAALASRSDRSADFAVLVENTVG